MITGKTFVHMLLLFQLITTCEIQKESIKNHKTLIIGKWVGKYKDVNSTKTLMNLTFFEDGSVVIDYSPSGGKVSKSQYKITDDSIICDFFKDGLKISKLNEKELKLLALTNKEAENVKGSSSIDAVYICDFEKDIEINTSLNFQNKLDSK
jgi:hypothetical protein